MESVLVTGGSGFIGRHLAPALTARGHRVLVLTRHSATVQAPSVCADLADVDKYAERLGDIDTIVHLAAATGKAAPGEFLRANVKGTAALLGAAERAGVARFLFVSTIAVTWPDKRRCYYAQSKEEAERLVVASPLSSSIVRPTQVFGKGSGLFEALRRLAHLPLVPAFGGGRTRMQPIFVTDLVGMLVDIIEDACHSGEILEMGGPEVVTVRSVLDAVHHQMRGTSGRMVDIPLEPFTRALTLIESLSVRAVPFTVGQLAAFRFDGTARPNPVWERRRPGLAGIDEMIRRSLQ